MEEIIVSNPNSGVNQLMKDWLFDTWCDIVAFFTGPYVTNEY